MLPFIVTCSIKVVDLSIVMLTFTRGCIYVYFFLNHMWMHSVSICFNHMYTYVYIYIYIFVYIYIPFYITYIYIVLHSLFRFNHEILRKPYRKAEASSIQGLLGSRGDRRRRRNDGPKLGRFFPRKILARSYSYRTSYSISYSIQCYSCCRFEISRLYRCSCCLYVCLLARGCRFESAPWQFKQCKYILTWDTTCICIYNGVYI